VNSKLLLSHGFLEGRANLFECDSSARTLIGLAFVQIMQIFSHAKIVALDEYDEETQIETEAYDQSIADALNALGISWAGEKTNDGMYLWRIPKQ
jgi:hypothetical protein